MFSLAFVSYSFPQTHAMLNYKMPPLLTSFHASFALQMFDWVYHNREEFLVNYVEIGHSYQVSKDLQETHSQFTIACQVKQTTLPSIHSFKSVMLKYCIHNLPNYKFWWVDIWYSLTLPLPPSPNHRKCTWISIEFWVWRRGWWRAVTTLPNT